MAREHRKNVRLNDEELTKFENFIEENGEFKSVSQMFRQAAHRYVNDYEGGGASIDPDQLRVVVGDAINPLSERVADIDEQLATLSSRVSNDDEIDKIARQVYHSLPVHKSPDRRPWRYGMGHI